MSTAFEMDGRTQNVGAFVGRILLSAIFIWSGYNKLMAPAATQAYFSQLGVPLPEAVWLFSVIVELGGGLAVLLGVRPRLAGLGLGVWCFVTAVVGHSDFANPDMQIHFMKNVAMAGGFTFLAVFGGGAYTLERFVGRSPSKAIV